MLQTPVHFREALGQRLQAADLELPVLPAIATQVLTMVEDSQSDASRLSALIHGDLALAARLLAAANTMAHGARSEIVSLQQAVARMGMNGVKEVVVAVCVRTSVYELPGHEDAMRRSWLHSLASGGISKEIARRLRSNVEQAYLCGLLHEIGRPVTLVELSRVEKASGTRLTAQEIETLLDEFSTAFGALIGRTWALPSAVLAGIAHYRDHRAATEHQHPVAITALADHLAHHILGDEPLDDRDARAHPAIADLNLYPEDVDAVLDETSAILENVEALAS